MRRPSLFYHTLSEPLGIKHTGFFNANETALRRFSLFHECLIAFSIERDKKIAFINSITFFNENVGDFS